MHVYANVLQQGTGDGCIQRQDAFQLSSFELKTCLKGSLSLATAQHRCNYACVPSTMLAFGQQCWACNSLQATALLSSVGLGFNCRMSCGRSNLRRSHKANIVCKVGIEDYGLPRQLLRVPQNRTGKDCSKCWFWKLKGRSGGRLCVESQPVPMEIMM